MSRIEQFEALLAKGMDNALLRYSLGNAYLQAARPETAVTHLRAALAHDPGYSAAWKSLGKALGESGQLADAIEAYRRGIEVAERKGDQQAAKEMRVFRKRLEKARADD
ncbi:MAG: tetratricopeptide repeat protein [Thiotrichales bacterium]